VQFESSAGVPAHCPVCEDERQYVGLDGQQWTTLTDLRRSHRNAIGPVDPGVWSIHTEPKFAIGQRCLLVQTTSGNVLWDCVTLLDRETVQRIGDLGGIGAIAISHPHYYSTMIEWAEEFDAAVYLHEDDREWAMRKSRRVHFWSGSTYRLNSNATLIRCGGHFEGAQVMHSGNALFAGDVIQVVPDRRWVSFMRSYPNYIPLSATAVRRIVSAVEPFDFDIIYGAWPKHEVREEAKAAIRRSAGRYISAIEG
jgi:glyoxylase-like metal-dependent hydrolase (beta-lactamase superfamily II)